ncbi:MAG: DUF599 domain-containing protein [Paracoccaceae bacterium]
MSFALPAQLSAADLAAAAFCVACWLVIGHLTEHPPKSRPSVSVLMAHYRREWLRQFVTRSPRIMDAAFMASHRQATAFLASASMIAIGGGLAMIRNAPQIEDLASGLSPLAGAPLIEAKMVLPVIFLANALLKFIWSHRLFGYCEILMGSVPNDPADPIAFHRAAQAAAINVTAAKSFNRGLRSIHFALGSLGWLLGPWGMVVTSIITTATLARREFASASRRILLDQKHH